jgi:hypothetical protein
MVVGMREIDDVVSCRRCSATAIGLERTKGRLSEAKLELLPGVRRVL